MFKVLIFIISPCILEYCSVECGRVRRIVGGESVAIGQAVMVASLKNASDGQHLCGCVLVTREWALTAAHCVERGQAGDYTVTLENYMKTDAPAAVEVLETHPHELYNRYTGAHDIAMIKLRNLFENSPTYEASFEQIILPTLLFGLSGTCQIYGYGALEMNSHTSFNNLHVGSVDVISLDDCSQRLGPFLSPKSDSGMLCATGNGTDACQGDSGSPMFCAGVLEGITSYGIGCAIPDMPGIYTSVAAHMSWIKTFLSTF